MTLRRRSGAALPACLLLLALLAPATAAAQSVVVRVLSAEESEPIQGALAHLVDAATGEVVRTSLSDERGRAFFATVPASAYRLRVEMIGRETASTEPFTVEAGAAVTRALALATRAIDLAGIEVTAGERRCSVRPNDDAAAVARVWDEARKALAAAALTDERGVYRYETVLYTRETDEPSGVTVDQEETRRAGYMRRPFESRPAQELVESGFVQRDRGDWVFYAPDASVLLSDLFLDTHCFRLAEGYAGSGLVGLSFEPTGDRRSVVDITGTLWLDAASAELRWLDFRYWNLGRDFPPSDAGGRVEFQRMPSGAWIVPDWSIRMPVVEVERGRPLLGGYRESGGRVLAAHEAGGRVLARRTDTGGVEGLVVDSAGLPVRGVGVSVGGSSQTVFTDAQGRFGITGLAEGTYEVRLAVPAFETFGYAPDPITRGVVPGEMSQIEVHLPSAAEVLAELCRDEPGLGGSAALVGSVVDARAADAPLAGATVHLEWDVVGGRVGPLRQQRMRAETTTDRLGRYRFCGVPDDELLLIGAQLEGRDSPTEEVRLPRGGAGAARVLRVE